MKSIDIMSTKHWTTSLKRSVLIVFLLVSTAAFGQEGSLELKYLGTAGWVLSDGNVTVLVDPYISRIKLGTGPSR